MTRSLGGSRRAEATALPSWIKPQLTKLVDQPPDGPDWLHEIKFDGYRMHARLDRGAVRLLTRTGLECRARRHRHRTCGIGTAVAPPPTAGASRYAARRAAAAREPIRVAARFEPRALGAARTGCRSQIPDLDRRQPAAPGRLPRVTRSQTGGGGPPRAAIPENSLNSRARLHGQDVPGSADRRRGPARGLHVTAGGTIARFAPNPGVNAPSPNPSARTIASSLSQQRRPHRAAAMPSSPLSPDLAPLRTASDRPFPDDDDSR
jgi:hypothetical protein